ncbi:hypothetical protein KQI58_21690 [Enterococcus raffinosus]|uniref:hypothetical protein n=1 Tax=Enterococcus raffinosus TaxID=71452 RepID=UPI001C107B99|nr:hypothetical protein [Enterococcus raffinosus]MBU5363636.1 hypothetical protein [Enterococcus raffinosus]
MHEYGITNKKLFTLSRRTVEKRIRKYYHETKDGTATIEMLIALQVRAELCESEFKSVLRGLANYIFLKTRSTAAMRRYYIYFTDYFGKKEWQLLSAKLFPAQTYVAVETEQLFSQTINQPLEGMVES